MPFKKLLFILSSPCTSIKVDESHSDGNDSLSLWKVGDCAFFTILFFSFSFSFFFSREEKDRWLSVEGKLLCRLVVILRLIHDGLPPEALQ